MAETERPNPFKAVFMDGKLWTTAQIGNGPPVLAEILPNGSGGAKTVNEGRSGSGLRMEDLVEIVQDLRSYQ